MSNLARITKIYTLLGDKAAARAVLCLFFFSTPMAQAQESPHVTLGMGGVTWTAYIEDVTITPGEEFVFVVQQRTTGNALTMADPFYRQWVSDFSSTNFVPAASDVSVSCISAGYSLSDYVRLYSDYYYVAYGPSRSGGGGLGDCDYRYSVTVSASATPGSYDFVAYPGGRELFVFEAQSGGEAATNWQEHEDLTGSLPVRDFSSSITPLSEIITYQITDGVAPVITPPADISVRAASGAGTASVLFAATVSDDSGATIAPVYRIGTNIITSPYDFPIGVTTVTIDATDPSGEGAEQVSFTVTVFDGTAPTVQISAAPVSTTPGETFPLIITFNEAVTGFTVGDIDASHASVSGFSGSGANYSATITISGSGDISIAIPQDAAVDEASNGNLASNTLNIAVGAIEHTQRLIANFMQTRANQLASNQPDLIPFLSGGAGGKFNLEANVRRGSFDFATGNSLPVWANVTGAWNEGSDHTSQYVFAMIDAHTRVNENLLAGAMLQFNHLRDATVGASGWMVGPYFVAKSANHPLYFEGRLLYGQTDNTISPYGTYVDSFNTTRMLAQIKMAGDLVYEHTTLSPFLDASLTTDDQHSYVDGLGNTIPAQGIMLGQIGFGLDISTMIAVEAGELELWGGLSGIWSHTSGSGFAASVIPDYEGGRARVEFGLNRIMQRGQRLSLASFYDGIGTVNYQSFGLSLDYSVEF